jgi:hypothetical protein
MKFKEEFFMKKLYFEGAGCVPRGNVPNCRIRTAFHLDDGRSVYLEITGMDTCRSTAPCYRKFTNYGIIDHLHFIPGNAGDDRGEFGLDRSFAFEYTLENILQLVNYLGASFDAVEVLPDMSGYRVHGDKGAYNYGDEFQPDREMIRAREAVDAFIRQRDIERGERFPCYSLWVDKDEPAMLHYKNFRFREEFDIYPGIPADLDKLPVLDKANAVPGCFYACGSGWQQLYRTYRISEEQAEEWDLMYLDRAESSAGDFALVGSDVYRKARA